MQLIAVCCTVAGTVWRMTNPIRQIGDRVEKLEQYSHNDYMRTLKLTIMNEDLPIEDRMEAGEAYTKEGGNGVAAATYKLLIERYMEDHKDG